MIKRDAIWFIGAASMMAAAVWWILPPTTPIGGARIADLASQQRQRSPAKENRDAFRSGIENGNGSYAAIEPRLDESKTVNSLGLQLDEEERDQSEWAHPDIAVQEPFRPEESFRLGYAWANEREVEDLRECNWLGDTPQRDGCLAFLDDAED